MKFIAFVLIAAVMVAVVSAGHYDDMFKKYPGYSFSCAINKKQNDNCATCCKNIGLQMVKSFKIMGCRCWYGKDKHVQSQQ